MIKPHGGTLIDRSLNGGLERKQRREQEILARKVFGTTDKAHAGVAKVLRMKEVSKEVYL